MKLSKLAFFTLTFIAATFAQTPKTTTTSEVTKAQVTSKKTAAEKNMTGMLISIDGTKQTFVVQLKGNDYTFQANPSTKIQGKNGSVELNDLKKGNAISVIYLRNPDSRTALSITQDVAVASSQKPEVKKAAPAPEVKKVAPVPAPKDTTPTTGKPTK